MKLSMQKYNFSFKPTTFLKKNAYKIAICILHFVTSFARI